MGSESALSLDGPFWRGLARWGSSRGPEWFVRFCPPVLGLVACAVATAPRRHVLGNLRRVCGPRSATREAVDVARTFTTYASCLAEILGAGSKRGRLPEALVWGEPHFQDAAGDGRGVIIATAHTAGWETVGPLLARDHVLDVMIVEQAERDVASRAIQDGAREAHGLRVAHAGGDPLAALPLVRHLRERGVVALQIDRVPEGFRSREVTLFGSPARVPEGPLRLSMLTGAPLLPVFAARSGHRRYELVVGAPLRVPRRATEGELGDYAQTLADALQEFVRAHPTQWFHFREG